MATLEELQKRIQRLEDIKQIEKLQRIYGYYRDYEEWEKVVDLFSDNAASVEECDYGVYKGKAGVRRYYIDLLKGGKDAKLRPGYMSIGMQIQGVVTVADDGQTAKGRWYGFFVEARPTLTLHDGELRQLWAHGIYENEYVKENGKWLFSKLHWNNTFCSPVEDGWLNLPLMGWMPLPDADAPPTAFRPYPYHRGNVPYHYQHPVTNM
jgi:hypothetical protein